MAHDLITAKQRLVRRVLAVVGAGVLGLGAFVIYKLATEDRAVAPCKHLAALGDPRAVELLVQYTQHRVVIDHLIDTKPVAIRAGAAFDRCKQSLDLLEHVMDNFHFVRLVDCVMQTKAADDAKDCFPRPID